MRRLVDLGPHGTARLVVHEHWPGGTHQPTLSILREHSVPGDLDGPGVTLSIVGEPYLTAIRDALNEALPR
ncbi:MAG: hypothetical protein ACREA0_00120 [bacterium]